LSYAPLSEGLNYTRQLTALALRMA